MSKVFVLDTNKKPLAPCEKARARQLLKRGKAAVYRRYPFTIILKRLVDNPDTGNRRLKIDPGSKVTGLAIVNIVNIVNDDTGAAEVEFAAELHHRGQSIKTALEKRRKLRQARRSRKTRYRQPRFLNRRRAAGWLAPSVMSRIHHIETWLKRLRQWCSIKAISMELSRFDTQKLQNPEINGSQYQQGELFGYEIREYLLEKFGRRCVYCGAKDIPLQVEHLIPKIRGGSDRVSNLTISCGDCNRKKGVQTAEEFGFSEIQGQGKKPLKDAAVINATRWKLFELLQSTGLPVECGTGGRTKFNRIQRGLPKAHWYDAACVGESTPKTLKTDGVQPLKIVACGRGSRQMCRMDRFGFPRTTPKRFKRVFGFQSGDMVKALVPTGKKAGSYVGRVAVRSSGRFNIQTSYCITGTVGTVQGIGFKHCRLLQHADGYGYGYSYDRYTIDKGKAASSPP